MTRTISNSDDVIDSSDIIERLSELEEMRRPYVAGWNMPGYMPDDEPVAFATVDEAKSYLKEEISRYAEEMSEIGENFAWALERLDASESEFGETIGNYHFWIAANGDFEDADDAEEYRALRALADEASDYASDWEYGETLIRYSYWADYVQELLEDCGDIPKDIPHYIVIDWEATARNIAADYTTVSFDGVEYYIRAC